MDENMSPENENQQEEIVIDLSKDKKDSMGNEIFEWVQAIVVALVVAMFLRTFVFTMVYVDGQSMEPTLHHAERMIVSRLGNDSLTYGDVVIFRPKYSPDTPYIKRVIATAGQEVSFDFEKGQVLVDGTALDEPYIMDSIDPDRFGNFNPYEKTSEIVPEGCIFVMGDNRNNSRDSRWDSVGMVSLEDVIGKAVVRVWPFNKIGTEFKLDNFILEK
ncbi:MAG: signal peptidase I [Clostridia bacterium]|nr:signal peptidase I [Clostridia bacterium]